MNCGKCGCATAVIGTRSPTKPGKGAEVKKASKVVGWYNSDFVVRLRKCKACNVKGLTIELPIEDIVAMIQESSVGHAPDELIQKNQ